MYTPRGRALAPQACCSKARWDSAEAPDGLAYLTGFCFGLEFSLFLGGHGSRTLGWAPMTLLRLFLGITFSLPGDFSNSSILKYMTTELSDRAIEVELIHALSQ